MPSEKTHLWIEEPKTDGNQTTLSSIFETATGQKTKLWYSLPSQLAPSMEDSVEAFIIGNIFQIMSTGGECEVHGTASPTLLRNLAEFQSVWECWRPGKYKRAEIIPESCIEKISTLKEEKVLATFTGGVDSCFTVLRHSEKAMNQQQQRQQSHGRRNVAAGLLVHGFDIPLEQKSAFVRAADRAKKTLESVKVSLLTLSSNLKDVNIEWDDTHIAGVASSMHLLRNNYSEGLVAASHTYDQLTIPWGSNPITDHLLSSSNFKISHDGSAFKRWQKIKLLQGWNEGFENLRVCYSAAKSDENCGRCLKCAYFILLLRTMKIALPPSMPDLPDHAIAEMYEVFELDKVGFGKLVASAKKRRINESWVDALAMQLEEANENQKRGMVHKVLRRLFK